VAFLFAAQITRFGDWIAFALLAFIGGKMIIESRKQDKADDGSAPAASLGPATMLPLAIATSIDALAAGVSFAFLNVGIAGAVLLIGLITAAFSIVGVKLGGILGAKFKAPAELIGGIILGLAQLVGGTLLGPTYQQLIGFIVLLVVLAIRPQGLLSKAVRK
jgi:putative Mn2+ efflux pump MntP